MSDQPVVTDLTYLTNPAKGEVILNVLVGGQKLARFQINREQLFGLNAKSADILLRDFK